MQIDLEKILVHANEKLGAATSGDEPVNAFKRFLKIETERLRIRHRFGLGGAEIMTGRSYIVDLVVSRACQLAAADLNATNADLDDCAILALGGYGRRELAPFSDVDVLFLHAGRRSRSFKEFVEQTLYLLWDMGLTVGHSYRSVSECVSMARQDLHSRNAMAEARLITGNLHLFRRLLKDLDDAVFKNRREVDTFMEAMRSEIEGRYEKFGRTVCLQEPNVKESAGGLRDLHTVLWVGHARFGCRNLDDLRAEDFISGTEYGAARRASSFIARVRNEAHFATGRRADLITLELQPTLASNLGYKDKRGLLASELFMRDYYQRANELHQFSKSFLTRSMESRRSSRRFSSRIKRVTASFEQRQGKFYLTMKRGKQVGLSSSASFEVRQGELSMKDEPTDLRTNPIRILELFTVAQAEGVDLSADLSQIVRESLPSVGRGFRSSPEAGRIFIEILNRKGKVGRALRSMYETCFLGRFLPEFARITFLVQHDFYHKYTIDEHTLKAIEVLDSLQVSNDPKLSPLAKVLGEIEDAAPLYLGLFLHDIGKGRGKGHVAKGVRIAETVCSRLSLEKERAARVIFLVKQHLLMSHLSQRRDISEESLIQDFVDKVGDATNLDMLLLLTYADTSGVGPGVWNDWKGTLLLELYTRARSHLTSKRPGRRDADRKANLKQQVIHELLPEVLPSEVERHFAMMPDRYFRLTDPKQIVEEFKMTKQLNSQSLAANWRSLPENHCTELTVCAGDRAGLFAQIAGTLTANGVNILSADLYTREDGVVLDTFKVSQAGTHSPVREAKWSRVEADLQAAIENRYDVDAAVESWLSEFHSSRRRRKTGQIHRSPTVRFESEVSAVSTVIEVRAEDEPGLAYRIASTLSELQLDISFARITTEKNFALDIFYVTGPDGLKLTSLDTQEVERALLDVLSGGTSQRLVKEAV
jgi:[protein-PII] uridylyltransferase